MLNSLFATLVTAAMAQQSPRVCEVEVVESFSLQVFVPSVREDAELDMRNLLAPGGVPRQLYDFLEDTLMEECQPLLTAGRGDYEDSCMGPFGGEWPTCRALWHQVGGFYEVDFDCVVELRRSWSVCDATSMRASGDER